MGKEARCQEEEQEQLHLGIQQLEQENKQLLARVDQEKKRTREVERLVEVMEERMKEMKIKEVGPSGEQEKCQRDTLEQLENKVGQLKVFLSISFAKIQILCCIQNNLCLLR